jgi:predicted DNA-binding transcriptional regulator YafY
MLMLLFTRDIVSIQELADELETNPRNIPEFRKELEAAGYPIETISGRYGGYRLKKNDFFPSIQLTDAEKKSLVGSFEYITKQNNFPSMPAYKSAMEKIMAANRYRTVKDVEIIMVNNQPLAMSEEEIQKRYSAINESIERRTKIKIAFRSNDNIVRERVIHPYEIYLDGNKWSTLGYCELVNDMRTFEFHRITSFSLLEEKFDQIYSYRKGSKWHDYLDSRGMKKVPDWSSDLGGPDASMRIKLRLSGKPAMYVKEYLYGINQTVLSIDKDTTILEFTAKYKYNTVKLVLGFGSNCEVLEPKWLRDEVIKQAQAIIKKHENYLK